MRNSEEIKLYYAYKLQALESPRACEYGFDDELLVKEISLTKAVINQCKQLEAIEEWIALHLKTLEILLEPTELYYKKLKELI
jgi:hypothetical protein